MINITKIFINAWLQIVEKYPVLAGTSAVTANTTAVVWTVLQQAQIIASLFSLTVAIMVGLVTLYGFYRKYKRGEF